jgi:hypothetical protein
MPDVPILTIDVAHPPRRPSDVEEELMQAWSRVRNSMTLRAVKVIHGRGSTGKGGSTRETVRNWIFRHRSKFRGVIEGEEYSVYHVPTQDFLRNIGELHDTDLGSANAGMTLIWIR